MFLRYRRDEADPLSPFIGIYNALVLGVFAIRAIAALWKFI